MTNVNRTEGNKGATIRATERHAMRLYFKTLSLPQLVDIANDLYDDNARLRRELDDKDGVIR